MVKVNKINTIKPPVFFKFDFMTDVYTGRVFEECRSVKNILIRQSNNIELFSKAIEKIIGRVCSSYNFLKNYSAITAGDESEYVISKQDINNVFSCDEFIELSPAKFVEFLNYYGYSQYAEAIDGLKKDLSDDSYLKLVFDDLINIMADSRFFIVNGNSETVNAHIDNDTSETFRYLLNKPVKNIGGNDFEFERNIKQTMSITDRRHGSPYDFYPYTTFGVNGVFAIEETRKKIFTEKSFADTFSFNMISFMSECALDTRSIKAFETLSNEDKLLLFSKIA